MDQHAGLPGELNIKHGLHPGQQQEYIEMVIFGDLVNAEQGVPCMQERR